jgi:lipopolysaccharide transport system ATP-binding protein
VSLRVVNPQGSVTDVVRSTEPVCLEMAYNLSAPLTGLRVGFYLMTPRGEHILTSFDTDDPSLYDRHASRAAGRYVSRCILPADFFNEGRYVVGVNASSFRIRRYFQDEQALTFTVDATGAPGTQWSEPRQGVIRPRLTWTIEAR